MWRCGTASTATCWAITRQESAFQVRPNQAPALSASCRSCRHSQAGYATGDLARHLPARSSIEHDLIIPERNIEIGSYHLAWLLKRYGNLRPLAIAAYNAGKVAWIDG